ncbi:unnamed protein product, partial [Discosporangium mesarthrocarpum]
MKRAQREFGTVISHAQPSKKDHDASAQLDKFLRVMNLYEDDEGSKHRKVVLRTLLDLVKEWSTKLGIDRGLPPEKAYPATLKTFGSYNLKVHTPDADIDILLLAPRHCTREDFFTSLCDKLGDRTDVKELFPVPGAYTPVIKFKLQGVSIDMLFCSLHYDRIPDSCNVHDDEHLRHLDDGGVRSLNGVRVVSMILQLLPQNNRQSFRVALRAIKEWARRRGV